MGIVIEVVRFALLIFIVLLLARVVLSLILTVSRDWKPAGVALVFTEGVYTVTDPPVKALRRLIPPLTIGQIRFDLSLMIVLLASTILYNVTAVI